MDNRSMEGMLWKAACSIRGEKDAPKFKDYILPLIFIKRLSDVLRGRNRAPRGRVRRRRNRAGPCSKPTRRSSASTFRPKLRGR